MQLLLWVAIVVSVLVVTLVLVRRNGLRGSGMTEDQFDSIAETNALEKRYQAEQREGGPRSG